MPTLKWILAILIFAGFFTYGMFQGGFVSWFLFYGVAALFVMSCLIPFMSLVGLKSSRRISVEETEAGSVFDVSITLFKPWFIPFFYYEVIDTTPHSIKKEKNNTIFFFSFAKEMTFSYEASAYKRGVYHFNETQIIAHDLFGLFWLKRKMKEETLLLVYPPYYLVQNPQYLFDNVKLAKRFKKGNDDHSIAGVRPYVNGDRMSRIDWKRSAGVAGLLTKEFETDQNEEVTLIVYPMIVRSKQEREWFEASVIDAASLASTFVRVKAHVLLCTYNQGWKKTQIEERSWKRGLRDLAQVEPLASTVDLPMPPLNAGDSGIIFLALPFMTDHTLQLVKTLINQRVDLHFIVAKPIEQQYQEEMKRIGAQPFEPIYMNRRADYA